MTQQNHELNDVEKYIITTLRNLPFGSVQVTLHNSQIVQVEKTEKRRFDNAKQTA